MADAKFAIWESWADTFAQLDDAQLANLVRSMCAYVFEGAEPDFAKGSAEALLWPVVKPSIKRSAEITRRNQVNGSAHTAKPSGKPTNEPSAEPNAKPNGKPNGKPTAKPSGKPTHEPMGKPSENPNRKEKKRIEGNRKENPEGFFSIPSDTVGAAGADAPPPVSVACPVCDAPMRATASRQGRKRIYRCNLCGEEKAVEEVA